MSPICMHNNDMFSFSWQFRNISILKITWIDETKHFTVTTVHKTRHLPTLIMFIFQWTVFTNQYQFRSISFSTRAESGTEKDFIDDICTSVANYYYSNGSGNLCATAQSKVHSCKSKTEKTIYRSRSGWYTSWSSQKKSKTHTRTRTHTHPRVRTHLAITDHECIFQVT